MTTKHALGLSRLKNAANNAAKRAIVCAGAVTAEVMTPQPAQVEA